MDTKAKSDVYRRTPTFTLELEMLEQNRELIMNSIMHNRFILMRDGRTLDWVEELIAKEKKNNPTPKEKEKKIPSSVN